MADKLGSTMLKKFNFHDQLMQVGHTRPGAGPVEDDKSSERSTTIFNIEKVLVSEDHVRQTDPLHRRRQLCPPP